MSNEDLKALALGENQEVLLNQNLIAEVDRSIVEGVLPFEISLSHVARMVARYSQGIIPLEVLLAWVNLVWFSDGFKYCEQESDEISIILYKLERLDELPENQRKEEILDVMSHFGKVGDAK